MQPLAASVGSDIVIPCDVSDEASMDAAFAMVVERWGKLDFVVHAIGFSDKNELRILHRQHHGGKLLADHADLGLQLYRRGAAGGEADAPGRVAADADLLRRGEGTPHYNVMGVAKAALGIGEVLRDRSSARAKSA